jgi:hypothetical protein
MRVLATLFAASAAVGSAVQPFRLLQTLNLERYSGAFDAAGYTDAFLASVDAEQAQQVAQAVGMLRGHAHKFIDFVRRRPRVNETKQGAVKPGRCGTNPRIDQAVVQQGACKNAFQRWFADSQPSLDECARRCSLCSDAGGGCRYATFSRRLSDCSMYSACDLAHLGKGYGYETADIDVLLGGRRPPAPPRPPPPLPEPPLPPPAAVREKIPLCFEACGGACDLHTIGQWVRTATRRATAAEKDPRAYENSCTPPRARRVWEPARCTLSSIDAAQACQLLRGTSVLMVGDSTMRQLFLALSRVLNARLGRGQHDQVASGCADTVRLSYARNDLVLYSADYSRDAETARGCAGGDNILRCWTERAADYDVVLLGVGQHFPGVFKHWRGGAVGSGGARDAQMKQAAAFAANSLNHTVAELTEARRGRGDMIVAGASLAVPGCAAHAVPLETAQAGLDAYVMPKVGSATGWSDLWWEQQHVNHAARLAAAAWGAQFLDLAAPSLQAAWGARGLNEAGREDCVHYCPESGADCGSNCPNEPCHIFSIEPSPRFIRAGVTDSWAQLLLNLLRSMWHKPALLRLGRTRLFDLPLADFLSTWQVDTESKKCVGHGACREANNSAKCLSSKAWWPFDCAEGVAGMSRCDAKCTSLHKAKPVISPPYTGLCAGSTLACR